jgi:N-acetylneuraminic acid mutarotase
MALIFEFSKVKSQVNWEKREDFGGTARYAAIGFSIGAKGYVGTGSDGIELRKDLWEYDAAAETWSQKADLPVEYGRRFAVAFSVGNFGYMGTGLDPLGTLDDFWQYDPMANTWNEKANFDGGKRYWATGFSIGNKGYIGFGYNNGNTTKKDFWEYDPISDTWLEKAQIGGKGRAQAVGFSIGNKGYIGPGGTLDLSTGEFSRDFWEYDPSIDTWLEKATFPGIGRLSAVAFSILGKGYIGTGEDINSTVLNDFWEYDPLTDSWMQVSSLTDTGRVFAAAFSIGNKGYVGTGQIDLDNYLNDFWEYDPVGCIVPGNLITTSITSSSAKFKWDAVSDAAKYKVVYKSDSIGDQWSIKTIKAPHTSLVITGLESNYNYKWKVKSICGDIKSAYSPVETFTTTLRLEAERDESASFSVYPNPLSASSVVSLFLETPSLVFVELFDLSNKRIKAVFNEHLEAGFHELPLVSGQLSAGFYILKLTVNDTSRVMKVVVE